MSNLIQLNKELYIEKQKGSNNFSIRLRVKDENGKGRYHRKSLKTSDQEEATKIAWGQYFAYINEDSLNQEFFGVKKACTVKSMQKHMQEFFNSQEAKTNQDYLRIFNNEIVPALGDYKIEDLDTDTIKTFISEHANSKTAITIRKTTFRRFFEEANSSKVVNANFSYLIPNKIKSFDELTGNPISEDDLRTFNKLFPLFIASARKDDSTHIRILLQQYIIFLEETGARPGEECLHMKFKDIYTQNRANKKTKSKIEANNKFWTIRIQKGKIHSRKASSYRDVPLSKKALQAIRVISAKIHNVDQHIFLAQELLADKYIFRLPTKTEKASQLAANFIMFCKYCDIDAKEKNYMLYSFRHTYITKKMSEGVDIALIAKQCGTSITVIEKYYDKSTSVMRADELIEFND